LHYAIGETGWQHGLTLPAESEKWLHDGARGSGENIFGGVLKKWLWVRKD
jgi:hypothetical protein